MINLSIFAENGTVIDGKVVRSEAAAKYGSWFSDNATPADLASWADARIQIYKEWIANCEALKRAAQMELIKGFDPAELQALLDILGALGKA